MMGTIDPVEKMVDDLLANYEKQGTFQDAYRGK